MIRINGTVALVFTFNKKFFSTLNHFTQIFFIHMKSWIIWLLFFYSMAKLWATMSKLGWKWRVSCIKTPQDWGSFGCLVLSNLPRSVPHIISLSHAMKWGTEPLSNGFISLQKAQNLQTCIGGSLSSQNHRQ